MAITDTEIDQRVRALAEPVVADAGLELVELDLRGQTGSRVVRVIVDADGGVDLDACAAVSRSISEALDEDPFIPGKFVLEVTSPGVDRPLHTARDFARNLGRKVRIWRTPDAIAAGEPGETEGEVLEVADGAITLQAAKDALTVPLEQIDRGKVLLPW